MSGLLDYSQVSIVSDSGTVLGADYTKYGITAQYVMTLGDFCTCLASAIDVTTTVYSTVISSVDVTSTVTDTLKILTTDTVTNKVTKTNATTTTDTITSYTTTAIPVTSPSRTVVDAIATLACYDMVSDPSFYVLDAWTITGGSEAMCTTSECPADETCLELTGDGLTYTVKQKLSPFIPDMQYYLEFYTSASNTNSTLNIELFQLNATATYDIPYTAYSIDENPILAQDETGELIFTVNLAEGSTNTVWISYVQVKYNDCTDS